MSITAAPEATHDPAHDPMRDTAEHPTLAHVAALAGVSSATASRVLNGSARVSPTARQQVRDAVDRLGYVRQRAARAVDRRPRSVAAVVCEPNARLFADPFYSRVLAGASAAFAERDMPMLLAAGERPASLQRYLSSGHIDGVLLIYCRSSHPLVVTLPALGVPVTLIGRPLQGSSLSYVDADNRGGARQAVEYLARTGRRRIVTIAGPPDVSAGVDRLAGFREGLERAGLEPGPIAYGDFTRPAGVHAMTRLLDHRPNLDAVFCASDLMAVGALHALRQSGRRVPEDVALVGFDDLPLAAFTQPPLTTIKQPVEEIGAAAARQLLAQMSGETWDEPPVLPTTLMRRQSA
ncbi:LacI family DNA-binding transcriptional regulator [Dactylosporangium sp. CA-139066]|uniref:LacI family DNA-binding transcriptional regulator n=1 Tax=Dactylosporangium sp. CA-139066 TaxID=3239930 RepID=UPI003D924CE2